MNLNRYILLVPLLVNSALAFAPQPFLSNDAIASSAATATNPVSSILSANGGDDVGTNVANQLLTNIKLFPFLIADEANDFQQAMDSDGAGGVLGIFQNLAIGIGVIVAVFIGLNVLAATVIIPAAAKELEQECKELAPEMWEEYQRKLEPGQTMGQRPDLIQELGIKLQPLLDAKIEKQFADSKAKGMDVSEDEAAWKAIDKFNDKIPTIPSMASPSSPKPDDGTVIIDVTNVGGNQWDDDGEDDSSKRKT